MYRASLDVQDGHSVEPSETLDALVINTIFFSLRNSTQRVFLEVLPGFHDAKDGWTLYHATISGPDI